MTENMPSIFIGSSSEGLDVAREIELQLQRDAITTIWKDEVFGLGSGTLESLMKVLEQFDFAVMVLSPDDLSESRGQSYASPRDNVIFELGLFMGRLGRTRVFVVHEHDANLKLPSDLAGIAVSPYRKRDNLSAALSPTCTPIIKAIRALGFSEQRTQQQIRRLEDRQKTTDARLDWTEEAVRKTVAYIVAYTPGYFAHQALCQIRDKADEYYKDSNWHKKRILILLLDTGYLQPPPGVSEVVFSEEQEKSNKRLFEIAALTPMAELMLRLREEVGRTLTSS